MNRAAHCALHGLALLVLLLAHDATAAPPLTVPHGRLGEPDKGTAPTALWQGGATPPFALETRWDVSGASGTLLRHALAPVPGGIIIAEGVAWDAAAMLPDAGARRLFTADAQGLTVPFTWDALDAAWHGWLALAAAGPDSQGERRLGFLRGERSGEGSLFRRRTAVLGDALHSLPLIVGSPAAAEPGPVYAAFRARQRARPLAIYLGSNDGMLHAFAADSGKELFAYLPRVLGPQVAALASPDYRPRPYVDGSAGAGDVFDGSSWRTLLASGMGMGARGLFALDITDPLQFGRTRGALWEFTERDDPAIGHLRAAPIVARLRTGKRGPLPVHSHFVVLASGINPLNGSADGALFLLRADQDRAKPWTAGASYFRIDTAGADPALPNALGPPALALRPDGSASHAYAGDLQGNLWRFDLDARRAVRLFTARDASGLAQPIMHAPAVLFSPGGGFLVLFSTGKFLEAGDLLPASFTPQSMYAIGDRPDQAAAPIAARSALARRTLSGKDSQTIRGDLLDMGAADGKRGWYFDFPHARKEGERSAGSPHALDGAVVFDTVLPGTGSPPARRRYVVDAQSGFALDAAGLAGPGAATGALLPPAAAGPLLLATASLAAGERDATGGITVVRTVTVLGPGPDPAPAVAIRSRAGRLAWREISNWQELHARSKETP